MMKRLVLVVLSVFFCESSFSLDDANGDSPKHGETEKMSFYRDSRGVLYMERVAENTYITFVAGPVPNTTLLLQEIKENPTSRKTKCVTLIKGTFKSRADVLALKPESVLQMSCTVMPYNELG